MDTIGDETDNEFECNKCECGICIGEKKILVCSLFYEYLGDNPDIAGQKANDMIDWFKSGKTYTDLIDKEYMESIEYEIDN